MITFLIAAAGAFALSPFLFPLARRVGAIDLPNDNRRMHKVPIPRLGGLAVFGGFLTSALLVGQSVALLAGGLVILSVGLVDDVYRVSARLKLAFQLWAAFAAVGFGVRAPVGKGIMQYLAAAAWLVILPNAFNLVDGLDGLCARVALFASLALFAIGASPISLALAGALAGFLPFNLRPAKMFLGDTGSLFVGFALGVLSLEVVATPKNLVSIFLIFALPLADTAFAFVRRISKGKSPFSPDRGHFHHRLVDKGFSHKEASLLLSLASLSLCAIATAL